MHWPHDQIMNLPHTERKRWCEEVSRINKKISDDKGNNRQIDLADL
jgi:hypothetical protein